MGDTIYGGDGDKIGTIRAVGERYLTVAYGRIRRGELYVPVTAVERREGHRVYLNVSKDAALDLRWGVVTTWETGVNGRTPGL